MSALARLSPRLRHGLADVLRWDGLRPVQEASVPVILDGYNAVVLAPTAGGKTEAAFLPCLDVLAARPAPGVGLLYVSPLVALLNNQEERARKLAGLVGLDAFKWHGNVNASSKHEFLDDPARVLLTTPESLEAMLLGRRVPVRDLFAHLRFAVVDEVHAFAGSDRGAHLIAVLERLARFSSEDVQRIGLSATVANPGDIGRWLRGSSRRAGRVVRPAEAARTREGHVVALPEEDTFRFVASRVRRGKTLVFVERRKDAEEIADGLHRGGALDFVGTYHSAVSRDARQQAEDAMSGSAHRNVCLTCTSAMELGVDIGDLDDVLQWEPPGSVSALLQRWGRTGRRAGQTQTTTIITRTADSTLAAAAQLSLAAEGWVEAVRPWRRAYHILLQQMLAEVLHGGGHTPASLWRTLRPIPAFEDVSDEDYDALLRHLLAGDFLASVSGHLVLGDEGERRFGAKRFQALVTSFETPDTYTVVDATCHFEIGQIESLFVEQLRADLAEGQRPVMLLAGRPWQVRDIQDRTAVVNVVPDENARSPKWAGHAPRIVARRLAWRHRELLLGECAIPAGLNDAAFASLKALQHERGPALRTLPLPHLLLGRELTLHTFAGTRVNYTLALLLDTFGATSWDAFKVTVRASSTTEKPDLDALSARVFETLQGAAVGITDEQLARMTANLKPVKLSKYQPFLPPDLARQAVADFMLDVPDTETYLREVWGVPAPEGGAVTVR